jgi:hypothetical protein
MLNYQSIELQEDSQRDLVTVFRARGIPPPLGEDTFSSFGVHFGIG